MLTFDKSKHKYYWNGEPVPAVSKILDVIDKSHALIPWAVSETVEHIRTVWHPETTYSSQEIYEHLADAKEARKNKSGEAAKIGTDAHKWIERYIGSRVKGGTFTPPFPDEPQQLQSIQSFLSWERNHTIEYLDTELRFCHKIAPRFAGTIDLVARVDGKLSIVDFKTSKAIYDTYYLQLAAYWLGFSDNHTLPAEQCILVRIPKDDNDFEVKYIEPREIEKLIEVFFAAISIYEFKNKKGKR